MFDQDDAPQPASEPAERPGHLERRRQWRQEHLALEADAGLAHLALLRGDHDGAAQRAASVVDFLEGSQEWTSFFGSLQPFQALQWCYAALRREDGVRAAALQQRVREAAMQRGLPELDWRD